MIRVLGIVTFKIFPALMGGQKGVALFYKYLAQHLPVSLAVSMENDTKEAQSYGLTAYPVLFPNRRIYANLTRLFELERLVKSSNAQVIITEHSYPAFIGLWLKRRTGKPFIIHSHNIEALRFKQMSRPWWRTYLTYERWIHRQADFNFFISEDDQSFALQEFGLKPEKCAVITYGIERESLPDLIEKSTLRKALGLPDSELLFLFNGTLDYTPNTRAVKELVSYLVPQLANECSPFKIVVTGNRATSELINIMEQCPQVLFRGFVNDIDAYYQAADLFINPITNDSGVKTKVIEALANNCTVVSFESGATGISKEVCGDMLQVVANGDYSAFAQKIIEVLKKEKTNTPQSFYDSYNWDNIAQKAAQYIKTVVQQHG